MSSSPTSLPRSTPSQPVQPQLRRARTGIRRRSSPPQPPWPRCRSVAEPGRATGFPGHRRQRRCRRPPTRAQPPAAARKVPDRLAAAPLTSWARAVPHAADAARSAALGRAHLPRCPAEGGRPDVRRTPGVTPHPRTPSVADEQADQPWPHVVHTVDMPSDTIPRCRQPAHDGSPQVSCRISIRQPSGRLSLPGLIREARRRRQPGVVKDYLPAVAAPPQPEAGATAKTREGVPSRAGHAHCAIARTPAGAHTAKRWFAKTTWHRTPSPKGNS